MEIYRKKINKLISKSKKIIFESFFKIIFKILEVNGKEINELLNKEPNKNDDKQSFVIRKFQTNLIIIL